MEVIATLPAFLGSVLVIAASPGPAVALILRRAALRGLRGAAPTVLGPDLGLDPGLAAAVARAGTWFRRPRVRRRMEAASGRVLSALGLRVAASSRRGLSCPA